MIQNVSHIIFKFLVKGFGMELHYFQTGLSFMSWTLKFRWGLLKMRSILRMNGVIVLQIKSLAQNWVQIKRSGSTSRIALLFLLTPDIKGQMQVDMKIKASSLWIRLSQNDLLLELKVMQCKSINPRMTEETRAILWSMHPIKISLVL